MATKVSWILVALAAPLAGCASPADLGGDLETSETALGEGATLTFGPDFRVNVTGHLERGKSVRVVYDERRLTACRGDFGGQPGWAITGYWRIAGGDIHSFEAGGFSASRGTAPPIFVPNQAGDLQVWFQNTSRWGCSAYDSDFGNNYRFNVLPAATDPGWLGNVRSVISRQTCNGPCEGDMRRVQGEIVYDTWARQRAAIRSMFFEVWKEGVTDFDNAELWRQLDVQIHSRVGSSGAFSTAYVGLDRRTGNNARYAIDLRALDPIPGMFTITKKSDCPAFPLGSDGSGAYVDATVELYFTVNGVELRPASGETFRVRYQNYKGLYAPCVP